jgi:hypothetical protein
MARSARYFLPDQPLHIIQRGNNRGAVFFAPADCARYRGWLAEAATQYGCAVHACVLMTNHAARGQQRRLGPGRRAFQAADRRGAGTARDAGTGGTAARGDSRRTAGKAALRNRL